MAKPLKINLALQGGGAHGAFTWGVLDRLLEDEDIEVAGISGTSAGALNGAAFKSGILTNGRQGAKENLEWLWTQVGSLGDLRLSGWMSAIPAPPATVSQALEYSLPFAFAETATRFFSPYMYGPFYRNPLERVVRRFKYEVVCADEGPAFFVCATNVRTGKIKVFQGDGISTKSLLASACLPTLFQAVEIDGEAYWDGGYTGNPALFPLFDQSLPDDIVIVNINPLVRDEVPKDPREILDRINEVSFNSSLLRELRAINFVTRLIDEGKVKQGAMKRALVHMIADDELMNDLNVATKLVPTPSTVLRLRDAGRAAADRFLSEHKGKLGIDSSANLPELYD